MKKLKLKKLRKYLQECREDFKIALSELLEEENIYRLNKENRDKK